MKDPPIQLSLEKMSVMASQDAINGRLYKKMTTNPPSLFTLNYSLMLLALKNITKTYQIAWESFKVLDGVNLEVQAGTFLSIMGPSGSGKSTLMNIIGLLDTPTSGEYYLDGNKVHHLSDRKQAFIRRQQIGFVFQNYSLIPRLSVIEQVMLPLLYQGFSLEEASTRAWNALESVWLKTKYKSLPSELSGGQKQRVAIARALVIAPKIILADEPTWALDSKTSQEIMDLFLALNAEWKTIIVITHEPDIANLAQRIIHIRDGLIV